jgi:cellulose biosynthesis protein BcsQ
VYSEAGGVGKTTLAANTAVAHARGGLDVLVIPLDPQDGNLSRLFGVDDARKDSGVDSLVRHMVNSPGGPFNELIRTVEGIDIIPEHNTLADLPDHLAREQAKAEELGDSYNIYAQLRRVLENENIPNQYDVIITDPPATESDHLYNAIYATRNVLIPVEPSWKGQASINGLEEMVTNFADELSIDVGTLGAVPLGYKETNDQVEMVSNIPVDVPEMIGERASLMEGCWKQQCSAFAYVREHRSKRREYEVDTLAKFDRIARELESAVGITAPNPPEPGDVTGTTTEASSENGSDEPQEVAK